MKFINNFKFMRKIKFKEESILPGFGITFGFTLLYLTFIIFIPISIMFVYTWDQGWKNLYMSPRIIHAFRVSFLASFFASCINLIVGFITAWVLERYQFPWKKIIDSLIDIPFALPTAVAGITLSSLYSRKGWIGKLLEPLNINVSYTFLGIIVALMFVSFPFVVRTIQPVIRNLDTDMEKAGECLCANRWQIFSKIIFPELLPGLITSFTLSFARSLGEYGSVIFISSNLPNKTEIIPLLIKIKVEQFDIIGATVTIMIIISFLLIFFINIFNYFIMKKYNF